MVPSSTISTKLTLIRSLFSSKMGYYSLFPVYTFLRYQLIWKYAWGGYVCLIRVRWIDYRIDLNATPGFYFSFWVLGWGSIQIWPTWGSIWVGLYWIKDSNSYLDSHIFVCMVSWNKHHLWFQKRAITRTHRCSQSKTIFFDPGGVLFKMGFYCFDFSFWLGFY